MLAHLHQHLDSQPYAGARLRCVASHDGQRWVVASLIVHCYPERLLPSRSPSCHYEQVKLLEEWCEPQDLPGYLAGLLSDELVIDGVELFHGRKQMSSYEFLPSHNHHSTLAGYLYEIYGYRQVPFHHDALVGHDLPFHSDMIEATRSWIELRMFHGASDARLTESLLFLPESRAGFQRLQFEDGTLSVEVHGDSSLDLRVKGQWDGSGARYMIDQPVEDGLLQIGLQARVDELMLYLVGSDDIVYDCHHEGVELHTRTLRKVLATRPGATGLEAALGVGEGEHVEFKPFIKPGDAKKLNEVIKTAIAFANTRGGEIFLGVDNRGQVVGVEKEVSKAYRRAHNLLTGLAMYRGELRQKLIDAAYELRMDVTEVRLSGHTVVVIRVLASTRLCLDLDNNLYVRKGAHNRRPDAGEIRRLVQSESDV